jgi:hypothetical protein
MATTLDAYLAVRIAMEDYGRPRYRQPLERITEPGVDSAARTDWTVTNRWIDSSGHRLSEAEQTAILRTIYGDNGAAEGVRAPGERYMAEHGLRHFSEYRPNSSFWTLQVIEAVWFIGFAAVLLAGSVWLVRRRTS